MQQSDVDRTISLLYKGSDLILKSVTTLTDVISAVLEQLNHDKNAQFLQRYLNNGGACEYIECSKGLEKELTQKLREEGIRFIVTASSTMDGKKMIVFADYDAPAVNRIVNEYLCEHNKGGLASKELVNEMSKGHMRKVKDLDLYEAEMLVGMAKERGISVALEEPEQNKFNVVYSRKDKKIMDSIKMSAAILKAHPDVYEIYKNHINRQEEHLKNIASHAISKENNIPLYIADQNGNTMIVTADKVTYREHGGAEAVIDYSDPKRDQKIQDYLVMMNHPAELSKEQFLKYQNSSLSQKSSLVQQAGPGELKLSDVQHQAIQKMTDNRILYEAKLAQDNPEQEIYIYSYLNSEMGMEEFKEYEKINQESVHDEKELRETDAPIIYDDARSQYRGFKDEIETRDYEDERYAEAVMENDLDEIKRMQQEFSRIDRLDDIRNDRNGNMIPDDRENL